MRIGLIAPADSSANSIIRGVRLGVTEANQTSRLFSSDVTLFEARGRGDRALAAAASLLATRHVQILIGASPDDSDRLAQFAESRGVLFLNVASRRPALRSACRRFTFHIEASDGMYAAALRLARGKTASVAPSVAVLWAPNLVRFGASELNKRYLAATATTMDGPAWAGWAAVKMVAEAALRTHSSAPSSLTSYFESVPTQFDGHKGWPLSFRLSDHELRQPLYVRSETSEGATLYQDIPDLRALTGDGMAGNANRILDGLAAGTNTLACKWGKH